ncbi:hypothetical protein BXY85_3998 [Roseivirga pacifica]|uniref:ParB/Sulfiredoxin domain-containing protein n=1 Tax=Roseivirga pacifica TaxID=1267423 RepID=A0A1I0Q003_9BACT|nr:hypothetical protein [Roseivirga pacifica]RKQ43376.1 hypothetical protein BXY85_3998 [Roseivirga pacifica]SEW20190.1 hypothetical protein SAMN05216290_1877 [Roseivirga pacifica]
MKHLSLREYTNQKVKERKFIQELDNGSIKLPTPLWATSKHEAIRNKVPESSRDYYDNCSIIHHVNLSELVNNLIPYQTWLFLNNEIFNSKHRTISKTHRLFELWLNGKKVSPPVITIDGNMIELINGMHRTNLSLLAGVDSIPLLYKYHTPSKPLNNEWIESVLKQPLNKK